MTKDQEYVIVLLWPIDHDTKSGVYIHSHKYFKWHDKILKHFWHLEGVFETAFRTIAPDDRDGMFPGIY